MHLCAARATRPPPHKGLTPPSAPFDAAFWRTRILLQMVVRCFLWTERFTAPPGGTHAAWAAGGVPAAPESLARRRGVHGWGRYGRPVHRRRGLGPRFTMGNGTQNRFGAPTVRQTAPIVSAAVLEFLEVQPRRWEQSVSPFWVHTQKNHKSPDFNYLAKPII